VKYFLYILTGFIFWKAPAMAQNNIGIFADVKDNDSLQKLVTIFTEQLKKSLAENFTVQPASSYKENGIYHYRK